MKTTNYEISKKLKEIGFEADFNFHYKATDSINLYDSGYEDYKERNIPSYDLETLLKAFPNITGIDYENGEIHYQNSYTDYLSKRDGIRTEFYYKMDKNELLVDAVGKLLLKELREFGIIKIIKFNK